LSSLSSAANLLPTASLIPAANLLPASLTPGGKFTASVTAINANLGKDVTTGVVDSDTDSLKFEMALGVLLQDRQKINHEKT
jgi:hypothetical protein